MLEDIATLTGAKAVTEDLGLKLEKLSLEDLGSVKKVIIDKDNTTIIGGAGKASEIQGRIKQLRMQIDEATSDYDKEKLQERLAKLVGGVAVIKVGAATEMELKEKKARVGCVARDTCRRRRRYCGRRRNRLFALHPSLGKTQTA